MNQQNHDERWAIALMATLVIAQFASIVWLAL